MNVQPTREFDVLIIGGGPAGSSLAWGLRHGGLRTAIMDKADFPRNKICAGWITPAVTKAIDLDLEDYARGRVLQPITGFRIGVAGERDALDVSHDDLGEPASYGIRRYEFDEYLLRRCGAELLLGQSCTRISRNGDAWEVNGHLRASILVGAGGHFCPVARHLGARPGQSECAVTAQELEIRLSASQQRRCNVDTQCPALYFCDDLRGYGWVFRKGDWINIGLGREDARRLPEQMTRFRQWLIDTGTVPPDLPTQFGGHAYLLSHHANRPLTGEHALLVGDAAGLAYPQSGEGIRPAVESGLLAAAVVRRHHGKFQAQAASEYAAAIVQRFGARTHGSTPRRQQVGFKARVGRALLRLPWFGRHVVIDRWFLHRHVRALADNSA